jgi:hypothetical protein
MLRVLVDDRQNPERNRPQAPREPGVNGHANAPPPIAITAAERAAQPPGQLGAHETPERLAGARRQGRACPRFALPHGGS